MSLNPYQEANDVQNASNLTGVVHAFSRAMRVVRAEVESKGGGTDEINQHIVVHAFLSKLISLSRFDESKETKALLALDDLAKSFVMPPGFKPE